MDQAVKYPMGEVNLTLTQYEGEPPKIYSTKQAAASLKEVQQACSRMGLVDLDVGTSEFTMELLVDFWTQYATRIYKRIRSTGRNAAGCRQRPMPVVSQAWQIV